MANKSLYTLENFMGRYTEHLLENRAATTISILQTCSCIRIGHVMYLSIILTYKEMIIPIERPVLSPGRGRYSGTYMLSLNSDLFAQVV